MTNPFGNANEKITEFERNSIVRNDQHVATTSGNPHGVTLGMIGAEPAFVKNDAFNKSFGTSAGDVLEGDTTTISPTEQSEIAANTLKVSASGSLSTLHSDISDSGSVSYTHLTLPTKA